MSTSEDTLAGDDSAARVDRALLPARGELVGRYMVLDEIGRGGMGVVFSAFDSELDRKVAIKFLLADDPQSRARMQREARALARVSHANVIAIHDVGTAADRAFIAMELVTGMTLATWCERPRPWRQIVELLVAAGRGLAAAHQAGLVHRDFKPANVLLAIDPDDRVLRVLVTDFGLARPIDRTEADALFLTPGPRGTPAYMAPERLLSDVADVRVDVFSFCVALCELVWGQRPFIGATAAETAMRAALDEPSIPLRRDLPGWLRRIVLRGLASDPRRRFASMDELLDAISVGQRQRARWLAAGVGAVGIVGVALAALLVPQPDDCEPEASLAGIWDGARAEAVAASFEASALPWAAESLARIDQRLDSHAASLAAALTSTCGARRDLPEQRYHRTMACLVGRREQLRALVDVLVDADDGVIERSIGAVAQLGSVASCSDVHEDVAQDPLESAPANERAALLRVAALHRVGKYAEAEAGARELVATTESQAVRCRGLVEHGGSLERLGRFVEAEAILFDAVIACELAADDEGAARGASWLVSVVGSDLGRVDEGERWSRLGIAIAQRAGHDRLVITIEGNLALLDWQRGDFTAAADHARGAVERLEAHGDPDEIELGVMMTNVGAILGQQKDFAQAREWFERALGLLRLQLPAEHPHVVGTMANLAQAMSLQGEPLAAAEIYEDILRQADRAASPETPETASVRHAYSTVLRELGRFDEALVQLDGALRVFEHAHGNEHLLVFRTWTEQAVVHALAGRGPAAVASAERAVALLANRSFGAEADGDAHFAMAEGLRLVGDDPTRARAEAELARASFARETWLANRVAEVDAWLAGSR